MPLRRLIKNSQYMRAIRDIRDIPSLFQKIENKKESASWSHPEGS
jgi:hypothetical protein